MVVPLHFVHLLCVYYRCWHRRCSRLQCCSRLWCCSRPQWSG
ncbi:hypothetical protein AZE42_07509, partial [Rhizopogon vesiculosus]